MANSIIPPKFRAFNHNGKPLAFGKVYTYRAGTNIPKETYKSEDESVSNTNPVILNADGYADIYLKGSYKIVLKDEDDVEVWTADPVSDVSLFGKEWVFPTTATKISAIQLKLPDDQTIEYHVGRRVRIDAGSVIVYGEITVSSFNNTDTIITLQLDSGSLPAGIQEVTCGVISAVNSSLPRNKFISNIQGVAGGSYILYDSEKSINEKIDEVESASTSGIQENADNIATLTSTVTQNKAAQESADSGLQSQITALSQSISTGNNIVAYTTYALLSADLAHDANTVGMVTNDADPAKNGWYIKLGASGGGSWQQSSYDRVAALENKVNAIKQMGTILRDGIFTVDYQLNQVTYKSFEYAVGTRYKTVTVTGTQVIDISSITESYLVFVYYDRVDNSVKVNDASFTFTNDHDLLFYVFQNRVYAVNQDAVFFIPQGNTKAPFPSVSSGRLVPVWNLGKVTVDYDAKTLTIGSGGLLLDKAGIIRPVSAMTLDFSGLAVGGFYALVYTRPRGATSGSVSVIKYDTTSATYSYNGYDDVLFIFSSDGQCIHNGDADPNIIISGFRQTNTLDTKLGLVINPELITMDLQTGMLTVKSGCIVCYGNGDYTHANRTGYVTVVGDQVIDFTGLTQTYLQTIYIDYRTRSVGIIDASMKVPSGCVVMFYRFGEIIHKLGAGGIKLIDGDGNTTTGGAYAEPIAFYMQDQSMTIDLQNKLITTSGATGTVIHQAGYSFVDGSQSVAISYVSSVYLKYVYLEKATGEIGFVEAPGLPPSGSVPIAFVYAQKLYALAPYGNITLIDESGNTTDSSLSGGSSYSFTELQQRWILPDNMWFITGQELPVYKSSMFSDYRIGIMNQIKSCLIPKVPGARDRYQYFYEDKMLNPANLAASFEFAFRHDDVPDYRYIKAVTKNEAASSSLSGQALNMLVIGDSLTEVGMASALKAKLEGYGATVTPVGTYFSSYTDNLRGEGRGYWNYRGFIGKDNTSSPSVHTRSPGGKTDTTKFENPFLKIADATDKANHPDWCFRFTGAEKELSYADDPNKSGDFYIFDFQWYMDAHSVPAPSFITIALSTNDINLDRTTYTVAEQLSFMRLGLEIMIKQIKKVLPNVPIGVVPAPAWSSTSTGNPRFANEVATWVEHCMTDIKQLQQTYTGLYVVPVWCHMNEDYVFPYSSSANLSAINNSQKKGITDWVHFGDIGRDQYTDVTAAWLANVI